MFIQTMDEAISSAMLKIHGSNFINQVLKFFTLLGEHGIVWIALAVVAIVGLSIKNKKIPFVFVVMALIGLMGWLCNDFILKPLVARPRPYHNVQAFGTAFVQFMTEINYKLPSGNSFPSGHSYMGFYAAMAATLYYKKSAFVIYPVALLIAFSRVFIGAHYFTDVLFGIAWGSALAVLGYFVGTKLYSLKKLKECTFLSR